MGRPKNPNKKVKGDDVGNGKVKVMEVTNVDYEKKAVTVAYKDVPVSELRFTAPPSEGQYEIIQTEPIFKVGFPVSAKEGDVLASQALQELVEENQESLLQEIEGKLAVKYVEDLKEVPLPSIELDTIRGLFPNPKCKIDHAYPIMKAGVLLEEAAIGLYYALPHNVHLRRALYELQLVHQACIEAVKNE